MTYFYKMHYLFKLVFALFLLILWACGEVDSDTEATTPLTVIHDSFTDSRDGYLYGTVQVGTQIWMVENLRYLPQLNGVEFSTNLAKYYVFGYNGTDVSVARELEKYQAYGVLYNWVAASTACPVGWHLPTASDWDTLIQVLGGSQVAGRKLKAADGWKSIANGSDEINFSAMPSGFFHNGIFNSEFYYAYWWSAEQPGGNSSVVYYIHDQRDDFENTIQPKFNGYAVRCVQN